MTPASDIDIPSTPVPTSAAAAKSSPPLLSLAGNLLDSATSDGLTARKSMSKDAVALNVATALFDNLTISEDGRVKTFFSSKELDIYPVTERLEIFKDALKRVYEVSLRFLLPLGGESPIDLAQDRRTASQLIFSDRIPAILNPDDSSLRKLFEGLTKSSDGSMYEMSGKATIEKPEAAHISHSGLYCVTLTAVAKAVDGANQAYQILTCGFAGDIDQIQNSFVSFPSAAISITKKPQQTHEDPERMVIWYTN